MSFTGYILLINVTYLHIIDVRLVQMYLENYFYLITLQLHAEIYNVEDDK